MIRTREERLQRAEARVVRAAVRAYEAFEKCVDGQGDTFPNRWELYDAAKQEESRAVKALLRERGKL